MLTRGELAFKGGLLLEGAIIDVLLGHLRRIGIGGWKKKKGKKREGIAQHEKLGDISSLTESRMLG